MARRVRTALAILAAWCVLAALAGCTVEAGKTGLSHTPPPPAPRAPVVMIIGDSFTVGWGPVRRWETYAAQAARRLGWQLITAGAGGTGYVNPGRAGRDFHASFRQELSWRPAPDLLIVSGGHNDRRVPASEVEAAADKLFTEVKTYWPEVRIVVIGPLWVSDAPRWAYDVRDAIAAAARRAGAEFLDPLAESDIVGDESDGVLPDGVHPTLRGHARLAGWLVRSLGAEPGDEAHPSARPGHGRSPGPEHAEPSPTDRPKDKDDAAGHESAESGTGH